MDGLNYLKATEPLRGGSLCFTITFQKFQTTKILVSEIHVIFKISHIETYHLIELLIIAETVLKLMIKT